MSEPIQVDNNGRRIQSPQTQKMLESMGLATRSILWEMDPDKIKIVFDAMKKKVDGLKILTSKELETAQMVLASKAAKTKNPEEKKRMVEDIKVINDAKKILDEAKTMGGGVQKPGFARERNAEIEIVNKGKNFGEEVQKVKEGLEGKDKEILQEQTKSNNPFELNR